MSQHAVYGSSGYIYCQNATICRVDRFLAKRCTLYLGERCNAPCDLTYCNIKIDPHVMCSVYTCTPSPIPTPDQKNIITWISIIQTINFVICFSIFLLFKYLKRREMTPFIDNTIEEEEAPDAVDDCLRHDYAYFREIDLSSRDQSPEPVNLSPFRHLSALQSYFQSLR